MKNQIQSNFFWNLIGSISNSALSIVLLIMVNRIMGETAGGIFTLAFSHSQLMYYIGTLEVRPLQSTDVKEKYSFSSYFSLRVISCVLMVICCLIYVIMLDGSIDKKLIIAFVCLYKTFEAMEDTFTAMYQQHDRIDFSGKVGSFRVVLTLIAFGLVLKIFHNLNLACIVMAAIGALSLLSYNLHVWKKFENVEIQLRFHDVKAIFLSCLPLFISVFVMLYISNAPKYAINTYCSDVIQNRYSILFMPAFAINLFAQFILRPLLTTMAKIWNENNIERFIKNILIMMGGIVLISFLGIAGAWMLGIPILNAFYGVNLNESKNILLWVMFYGGLNAINVFLYDMIAVTRQQKWLLVGYVLAAGIIFVLAPIMVKNAQMLGAIQASIISISFLDLILMGVIWKVIQKKRNALLCND